MTKPLPTSDGHHDRADLRALSRATLAGWLDADPDRLERALITLAEIANDPSADKRARVNAAEAITKHQQKAAELGIRLAEFEDKADRLDAEKATEITESRPIQINIAPAPRLAEGSSNGDDVQDS